MSRKNKKSQPRFQEYKQNGVTIEFGQEPTRGGRGYRTVAAVEVELTLEDGTSQHVEVEVSSGTPRFRPQPFVSYVCDLKVRWVPGESKAKGRVIPSRETVPLLSEQEWIADVKRANTQTLTFRKGNTSGAIAFYEGNPVFPERGVEVVIGQSCKYLLLERDGFRYHAVLAEAPRKRQSQQKKGLSFVTVRIPKALDTVVEEEKDLRYESQQKPVWELLGLSRDTATEQSVRTACEQKIKTLGLGKNKPFILKRFSECFAEALTEARDQALEIIGVKPETAANTEEEAEASEADLVEVEASEVSEG